MIDEAKKVLGQGGVTAVVAYLNEQEDRVETAETYHKLMKDLYWKEKNVPDMVAVAQAGMDYGLPGADACEDSDPKTAYELRSWVKSIAYDLASFTWRGWDEAGIVLTGEDEALGLQAAELNLRLAEKLDKGALRISRAYWMLGAQQMAAGQLSEAEENFRAGVLQAAEVEAQSDMLISRAFELLAAVLRDPDNRAKRAALEEAKSRFSDVDYGDMYLEQVETAEKMFA